MMTFRFARTSLAGLAALLLASSAAPTSAHAVTYYFTQAESGLGGNLPPPGYGSVDVTTVGSDLKFELDLAPNWFVHTGSHHAVAFTLATGGLTISGTPTITSALASPFEQASGSSFSNSPFGPFNYAINCDSPGNGANSCNQVGSLVFYVLGAGSLGPVLTDGVFVTADIFSSITKQTGVVGATAAPVPGPLVGAGIPGLVIACGGLLVWARRRKAAAPRVA